MSTVRGKGWRPREGIEKVLKLSPLASAWANRPQNFDRIQAVLDAVPAAADTLVKDTVNIHNMSFSGVLLGRSSTRKRWRRWVVSELETSAQFRASHDSTQSLDQPDGQGI